MRQVDILAIAQLPRRELVRANAEDQPNRGDGFRGLNFPHPGTTMSNMVRGNSGAWRVRAVATHPHQGPQAQGRHLQLHQPCDNHKDMERPDRLPNAMT